MEKKNSNRKILKNKIMVSDVRAESDMANGIKQPSIQKPCPVGARIIDLCEINKSNAPKKSFFESTFDRCSRRNYTDAPLSLYELSYLLWCTQGIKKVIPGFMKYIKDGSGRNYLRPAPSVTNPFESYILIQKSDEIKRGLYRYLPLSHQLCFMKSVHKADEILISVFSNPSQNQSYTTSAAAVFFWSCIPYRGEWRSNYHIHKIILLDLGHVAQNLYLAAESIDCGCCEIGGYNQANADAFLEIDGNDEFTILCASAGHIDLQNKDVYKHLPDFRNSKKGGKNETS